MNPPNHLADLLNIFLGISVILMIVAFLIIINWIYSIKKNLDEILTILRNDKDKA